jgi:hypothetical protein
MGSIFNSLYFFPAKEELISNFLKSTIRAKAIAFSCYKLVLVKFVFNKN